jgi:hypothetical protein
MQDNLHFASASSAIISPTQADFVKFLQKCASSPLSHKKQSNTTTHVDGSLLVSPELLADTLLNWDASSRLGVAESCETPSWPALRVLLQQQGFPHDSLPNHMAYSSHADACVRGILGDVLVQYSLRGQLVQQLIDTVEFASMHHSHSSLISGSSACAAHELSRILETNQFRSLEDAAVQRATEQNLRQQLRQAENDLISSKERNRQLRSQVSDLEEEVHLMTRQLSKLRGSGTPAAAPVGNGRWEPPQVPLFKLPSTATSPVHPAGGPSMSHDVHTLSTENEVLKQALNNLRASYEDLKLSTGQSGQQRSSYAHDKGSCCHSSFSSVKSASAALETDSNCKSFVEQMFLLFKVADFDSCSRVARATLQLANTLPHLQCFAAKVSALCKEFNPGMILDSPEDTLQSLRAICNRLSELSAATVPAGSKSVASQHHLQQSNGLAVVSVDHALANANDAHCVAARSNSGTFDGSNLVFFTGPQSEDSLAASPRPHPPASALSPSAVVASQPHAVVASQDVASSAAVTEAMDLVGCTRPEELLICVEHLLVQSDELQHLRAVLSRRLDLTNPSAAFVDATLGAQLVQQSTSVARNGASHRITLCDPIDGLLPDEQLSNENRSPLLDVPGSSTHQSLSWDIVIKPARRPKPVLTLKPTSVRSFTHRTQVRDTDHSKKSLSQSKLQHSLHEAAGFSQQLFANFKRRLISQRSAAAADLLSASRLQQ